MRFVCLLAFLVTAVYCNCESAFFSSSEQPGDYEPSTGAVIGIDQAVVFNLSTLNSSSSFELPQLRASGSSSSLYNLRISWEARIPVHLHYYLRNNCTVLQIDINHYYNVDEQIPVVVYLSSTTWWVVPRDMVANVPRVLAAVSVSFGIWWVLVRRYRL